VPVNPVIVVADDISLLVEYRTSYDVMTKPPSLGALQLKPTCWFPGVADNAAT
jgi:hypothetical protein